MKLGQHLWLLHHFGPSSDDNVPEFAAVVFFFFSKFPLRVKHL